MNKFISGLTLLLGASHLLAQNAISAYDLDTIRTQLETNAKSGFQLAGYSSFNYTSQGSGGDAFDGVKFAPIFHYQYSDIIQFEGELEFSTTETGETEFDMEYAAATLFLNDYMGLQIGKFMSPIGQFVQNQHPSWINKMPTAPLGFGHDGAAPTSNIGAALRGGLPKIGSIRNNYVLFVANAPSFGKAADGDVIIDATGKTTNGSVAKLFGGRYAINPTGNMEIGVSGSLGELTESNTTASTPARAYSSYDIDFMAKFGNFDIKAELVTQIVGSNANSSLEGGIWQAWYTQVSYLFGTSHLEPVLRYSDYHNPESKRKQMAAGLNYLFANNIIAKAAYEYDIDESDSSLNDQRFLMQLAFGF